MDEHDFRRIFIKAPPPQVRRSPLFLSLPESQTVLANLARSQDAQRATSSNSTTLFHVKNLNVVKGANNSSRNTAPDPDLDENPEGVALQSRAASADVTKRPSLASLPTRMARDEVHSQGLVPLPRRPSSASVSNALLYAQQASHIKSQGHMSQQRPASSPTTRPSRSPQGKTSPSRGESPVKAQARLLSAGSNATHRSAGGWSTNGAPTVRSSSANPSNRSTATKSKSESISSYCATMFMVDQAREVKAYEEAVEQERDGVWFQRERRWALLRMREVEKDTRIQREMLKKKKLREARLVAAIQEEEIFAREKESASYSERRDRSQIEGVERKDRARLAYGLWHGCNEIQFARSFSTSLVKEAADRFRIEEDYINDTESKVRSFFFRLMTSERTALFQNEKSERIIRLRYVMAYAAWKGEQDQQVNNMINAERKQRYKVYDQEGIGFGEIEAIKQGILVEIAREIRKKHEAYLAAIREMELFHQHQRRMNDEEEAASRNNLRNDEQTGRSQIRLTMLDDRKAAHDATTARLHQEHLRWKEKCRQEQLPLIQTELDSRRDITLDEITSFRVLTLIKQQLWDEILTPLAFGFSAEDSSGAFATAKKVFDSNSEWIGSPQPTPTSELTRQLRTTNGGSTKIGYDLCLPYSCGGLMLCPGVVVKRKMDSRHYTTSPLTQGLVIVRLRGGGNPGDEIEVNAAAVNNLRERTLVSSFPPAGSAVVAAPPPKAAAKGTVAVEGPTVDLRAVAQQLLLPYLRVTESSVYDEDGSLLCTVESSDCIPAIDECATFNDFSDTMEKLSDEQAQDDGIVLLVLSFPAIEKDNVRNLERILQSLTFHHSGVICPRKPRRVEVEVLFSAPLKRRPAAGASLNESTTLRSAMIRNKFVGEHSSAFFPPLKQTGSQSPLLGSTSSGQNVQLTTYRLQINVRLIPAPPFLTIASCTPLVSRVSARGVIFYDIRGKNKTYSHIFPNLRTNSRFWWWPQEESPSANLVEDFQGSVIRLRLTEGTCPEDSFQFLSNDEFIIKKDEIKYNPPLGSTTGVDPFTVARVVHGKIIPSSTMSSKEIWFAVAEPPSYWSPTPSCPLYVPPQIIERFFGRLQFGTTSSSTARRVVEATIAVAKKFGGLSVVLKCDVNLSGSPGTVCGSWTGHDDQSLLLQNLQYVDTVRDTPEHLQKYLSSDAIPLFLNLAFDGSSRSGLENVAAGIGGIRVSIVENAAAWDRIDIIPRSVWNSHGLLTLSNSGSSGMVKKVLWSTSRTDDTLSVHVATLKRFQTSEGKVRPGFVVEFTDSCKISSMIALLKSIVFRTSVPRECDGVTKTVLLELAYTNQDKAKEAGGAKKKDSGKSQSDNTPQTFSQMLLSPSLPMRFVVNILCGASALSIQGNPTKVLSRLLSEDDDDGKKSSIRELIPNVLDGVRLQPRCDAFDSGTLSVELLLPAATYGTSAAAATGEDGDASVQRKGSLEKSEWQVGLLVPQQQPALPVSDGVDDNQSPNRRQGDQLEQLHWGETQTQPKGRLLLRSNAPEDDPHQRAKQETDGSFVLPTCAVGLVNSTAAFPAVSSGQSVVGVASTASGAFTIHLGGHRKHDFFVLGGSTQLPSFSAASMMKIFNAVHVSPKSLPIEAAASPRDGLVGVGADEEGTADTADEPSPAAEMSVATFNKTESVILRVSLWDSYGRKHQCIGILEMTPKNLPSYFDNAPGGAVTWRSGSEGYINQAMPLMPMAVIRDLDTEACGVGAFLKVEALAGFTSEDRLEFVAGALPEHLTTLEHQLKIVEFVEPSREGEIRRYTVLHDDGHNERTVGNGSIVGSVFSFTFARGTKLPICTELLRHVVFRHTEQFPYRCHARQILFRFNAKDDDNVVDTRKTLDVQLGLPLLYTLPLYEAVTLRHSNTAKQIQIFPKVMLGVPPLSDLGVTLTISLDTRVQDDELTLALDSETAFFEDNGTIISLSCVTAGALGVKSSSTACGLGKAAIMEEIPVAPTPGYDGVLFGRVVEKSRTSVVIRLADATMTRGEDVLAASAVPFFLSKVMFVSNAIEPIVTPRTAFVSWRRNDDSVGLSVRVLVEPGEPIGTVTTDADSVHAFLRHPKLVIPDASIVDVDSGVVLGREAELVVRVVDGSPLDRLIVGSGGLFEVLGSCCCVAHGVSYVKESRVILVDGDDFGWVEVEPANTAPRLSIKFNQCPISAVTKILQRVAFIASDPQSVGKSKLLEISLRLYASQPAPSIVHLQLSVHPHPVQLPLSFPQRCVEWPGRAVVAGSVTVPLWKSLQWSSNGDVQAAESPSKASLPSSATHALSTQGLVVCVTLQTNVKNCAATLFEGFGDDSTSLSMSSVSQLPAATAAYPPFDRILLKNLPGHLTFGPVGKNTIVYAGKSMLVCSFAMESDGSKLTLVFPKQKPVPGQLVADVLQCIHFEFSETGGVDAVPSAPSSPDAKAKGKGKEATQSTGSVLPQALQGAVKGDKRHIAVLFEVKMHASRNGADSVVGEDVIPLVITAH